MKTNVVHLKVIGLTADYGNLMTGPRKPSGLGTKGVESAGIGCIADNLGCNLVGLIDIGHHVAASLTHFGRFPIDTALCYIKSLFAHQFIGADL